MKLALFLLALPLAAQPVYVYSEFARLDAKGKPTAPAEPREILSPAVARNGFTSFQVVIAPSDNAPWQLYIAQNPENAVEVALYRQTGDKLDPIGQPATGSGPAVFWMDLRAARNAPVERIKVEPQLNIHGDWIIYPMEARIMAAVIPDAPRAGWPTGTATPEDVMRGFLCGAAIPPGTAPKEPTVPSLRFRNAQQDRALAAQAPRPDLQQRFGSCDAPAPADNPESYYRVRDYLYRLP